MKNIDSLKKNSDFQKVYRRRDSKGNRLLVMYKLKNDSDSLRIGISVSKKVGNSIVRHRLTRLIRESYRLNEEKVARGYDMVVIARSAAKGKNYHDIESAFLHLGSLHGIIES